MEGGTPQSLEYVRFVIFLMFAQILIYLRKLFKNEEGRDSNSTRDDDKPTSSREGRDNDLARVRAQMAARRAAKAVPTPVTREATPVPSTREATPAPPRDPSPAPAPPAPKPKPKLIVPARKPKLTVP